MSEQLNSAINQVNKNFPLPRCTHNNAIFDHAGDMLFPWCGCGKVFQEFINRKATRPPQNSPTLNLINAHINTAWYRGECCSGYPNCIHRPQNSGASVEDIKRLMNPTIEAVVQYHEYDGDFCDNFEKDMDNLAQAIHAILATPQALNRETLQALWNKAKDAEEPICEFIELILREGRVR